MIYLDCSCGKRISSNAKHLHERGKVHHGWVAETGPAEYIDFDEMLLPELESALGNTDPVDVARAVRKVFASQRWPNATHPANVRDFLEQHGIPIFDTPARGNEKNVHKTMFAWRAEHLLH